MVEGPSVQKMSQELERLFAPPTVETVTEEEKDIESETESQDAEHLLYTSATPAVPVTPSPVSTPTKPETETTEEPPTEETPKEATYVEIDENGDPNSDTIEQEKSIRTRLAGCMQPNLTQEAANAMARHVVNKLRKEAAALMEGTASDIACFKAVSPIARIRDQTFQSETMTPENEQQGKTTTEEKEKEERIKEWKRKAKIAQAQQRREQNSVQDEFTIGPDSRYNSSSNKNSPIMGCLINNVERTDIFNRLSQCSGGIYNARKTCAPGEFEECGYRSSSSIESEDDETTEDDTTEDDFGRRRQRGRRRRGKKKWENHSLDSSSADTTVPEALTASFLVSEDGSDQHDDGYRNRSRTELNRSSDTGRSDFALAGYTSVYSSRASSASGSKTSRINHTSMNRLLNVMDTPTFVKSFVQDMESKGKSMLWHQHASSMNPTTVIVRLKKGYRMPNGKCCAPRLIWTDLRSKQNYGFDIFDIKSMDHANTTKLQEFRYAIPGRSVLFRLSNSTVVFFESGTEVDMVRFVKGMKKITANLTHNLVTGNLDGCCELLNMGFDNLQRNRQAYSKRDSRSDANWFKAMDDVTESMIDDALASATFEA